MDETERVLSYENIVCQLSAYLKSMVVNITDQEVAMTVLCGLPSTLEHLIVANDAVSDDDKIGMDVVKGRLVQEEERVKERAPNSVADSALVNKVLTGRTARQVPTCTHRQRRGHSEGT